MTKAFLSLLLLLLLLSLQGQGRYVTDSYSDSDSDSSSSSYNDLVSDGIGHGSQPSLLLLKRSSSSSSSSSSETCEETYGFLPCTTTVLGNLFMVLVYGSFMFMGAKYLSTGSELLLEILGPGVVGGLFLPILGALPDALLILDIGLCKPVRDGTDCVIKTENPVSAFSGKSDGQWLPSDKLGKAIFS